MVRDAIASLGGPLDYKHHVVVVCLNLVWFGMIIFFVKAQVSVRYKSSISLNNSTICFWLRQEPKESRCRSSVRACVRP